jgi:hypothetical protein
MGHCHEILLLFFANQQNSSKPISAISLLVCRYQLHCNCSGQPIEMDKPHIFWLQPLQLIFLLFKEKVPFKCKKYLLFNAKGRIVTTFDPCQFVLDMTFKLFSSLFSSYFSEISAKYVNLFAMSFLRNIRFGGTLPATQIRDFSRIDSHCSIGGGH